MTFQTTTHDSLANFKRNSNQVLSRLRKTGRPVVLTVRGHADVVVQDAAAYQELLDQLEELSAVEGIKRGLEDIAQGRSRPLKEVIADKKKKHGL